jgi:DNA-binding CsgD family transcriptional regulator
LCAQAHAQGALLSNYDLGLLLNHCPEHLSALICEHERRTGTVVPRRATLHDMGSGLTHKRIICLKRYAEGKEPHQIAEATYHSLEAVDHYLGQYDRVRHCRLQGLSPEDTAYTLGISRSLVMEYLAIDDELGKEGDCLG